MTTSSDTVYEIRPQEDLRDVRSDFRFLNGDRSGTILAVQPLIAFLSQRQEWLR